jgi:hypothetical protein
MAINPLINQKLLEAAPNEAAKDQAQYFTPVLWAEILGWVLRNIQVLQPFQPAKSLSRC